MPFTIIVDSSKRDSTETSNSFVFTTKRTYGHIKTARVTTMQLLATDYVINDNNRYFYVTVGVTLYTNTLTRGTWSAPNYATQLQTDLNTTGNWNVDPGLTWTVTYSTSTNKYTISATSAFYLNFNWMTRLASKLGFNKSITTSATSHTSPNASQFFNSRYYNVIIPELQRDSTEGLNSVFARIYNNVQPNEIIDYHEYFYKNIIHTFYDRTILPNKFTVTITDDNNDIIELNGSDHIMEIEFS